MIGPARAERDCQRPGAVRARLGRPGARVLAIALAATIAMGAVPVLADPAAAHRASESAAHDLVAQLRDLPLPMRALPRGAAAGNARSHPLPALELRRQRIYDELHALGPASVAALARGLRDRDPAMRRNVAVTLDVLGGDWWHFPDGKPALDLRPALPALIAALRDPDPGVRAWAAQDVGDTGAAGAAALPDLRALLHRPDSESRGSACRALGRLGAAARPALPDLRSALADQSPAVRQAAREALNAVRSAAGSHGNARGRTHH